MRTSRRPATLALVATAGLGLTACSWTVHAHGLPAPTTQQTAGTAAGVSYWKDPPAPPPPPPPAGRPPAGRAGGPPPPPQPPGPGPTGTPARASTSRSARGSAS